MSEISTRIGMPVLLLIAIIGIPVIISLIFYFLNRKEYAKKLTLSKFIKISFPSFYNSYGSSQRFGIDFNAVKAAQMFSLGILFLAGDYVLGFPFSYTDNSVLIGSTVVRLAYVFLIVSSLYTYFTTRRVRK